MRGSICQECDVCKDYIYIREGRNGKLHKFLYCKGASDIVDYSEWYIKPDGYVYSSSKIDGCQRLFHTFFKTDNNLVIDHMNGNKADNRLRNLRQITSFCNTQNKHKINKTSIYPGVYWHKGTKSWCVALRIKGVNFSKSGFDSELEAYDCYVNKVKDFGYPVNTQTLGRKVYVEWKKYLKTEQIKLI